MSPAGRVNWAKIVLVCCGLGLYGIVATVAVEGLRGPVGTPSFVHEVRDGRVRMDSGGTKQIYQRRVTAAERAEGRQRVRASDLAVWGDGGAAERVRPPGGALLTSLRVRRAIPGEWVSVAEFHAPGAGTYRVVRDGGGVDSPELFVSDTFSIRRSLLSARSLVVMLVGVVLLVLGVFVVRQWRGWTGPDPAPSSTSPASAGLEADTTTVADLKRINPHLPDVSDIPDADR